MKTRLMDLADKYASADSAESIAVWAAPQEEFSVLCRNRNEARTALEAEIDRVCRDAELGRIAIRFVDRAGDYCDVDPAERICDQFYKAMADVIDAHFKAAVQGEAE